MRGRVDAEGVARIQTEEEIPPPQEETPPQEASTTKGLLHNLQYLNEGFGLLFIDSFEPKRKLL